MSYDQKTGICFCHRCGYEWRPKQKFDGQSYHWHEPRSCARCKSKVWNQPRVYAGKYISGTLARRYKPTGRAASKIVVTELPIVSFGQICAKCGLVEGFNMNCCKGKVIVESRHEASKQTDSK